MSNTTITYASLVNARNKMFQGELGTYEGVKIVFTKRAPPVISDAAQRMLFVTASSMLLAVTWAAPVDARFMFMPTVLLLALFWIAERLIQRNYVEAFAQALLGEDEPEMKYAEEIVASAAARKIWGDALFRELKKKSRLVRLLGIPRK